MGHRYDATVTFPRAALRIVDVRAAVDEFILATQRPHGYHYEINEDDAEDTIELRDMEANYGHFDILAVLDAHQVPYDRHHSEGEGCDGPFDVYVRWSNGEMVETCVDEGRHAEFGLARRLWDLLNADDVDGAKDMLDGILVKEPLELSELGWEP